ncbi:MAG TPA: cytochrome c biogenesis protein ResB [Deltaproteobacteria bacterium]|nr:cytochrome c biogenesis protein ResB [Deltaproteobacteria bacterium]
MLKTLSSLKLTVVLLFFITLLCLVGTIFPQGHELAEHGHGWASRIPSLLSPYDIFHSAWFLAAGFLLIVNIVLCMRRRVRLKRRNVLMLLLHGSILLVIVGYAMGSMGVDGFVEIPEGGSVSQVDLRRGSSLDLGFSVRCDRFVAEYYENGMPKEYVSDLSFVKNAQVVSQARLKVNHPASFEGMSFYQESFRQSHSAALTWSDGKKTVAVDAREGDVVPLLPAGTQARVVKIWDDLMHAGPAVKLLIQSPAGERYLWVFKEIEAIKGHLPDLFERAPELDPSGFRPYTFSLGKLEASSVTGIGVRRDPGIPLVAVGGGLFLVSLLLMFLAPPGGAGGRPRREDGLSGRTSGQEGAAATGRVKAKGKGSRT